MAFNTPPYSSSNTGSTSPNLLSLHTATAAAADKQRLNVTCVVANCPILPASIGNSDGPVLCPLKFLKGSCSVLAKGFLQADAWVVSKDVVLKEVSSACRVMTGLTRVLFEFIHGS